MVRTRNGECTNKDESIEEEEMDVLDDDSDVDFEKERMLDKLKKRIRRIDEKSRHQSSVKAVNTSSLNNSKSKTKNIFVVSSSGNNESNHRKQH